MKFLTILLFACLLVATAVAGRPGTPNGGTASPRKREVGWGYMLRAKRAPGTPAGAITFTSG